MKFVVLSLMALALSACQNYSFNSNLNPNNIIDYYKISSVKDYDVNQLQQDHIAYKSLGLIKGLSCQLKENEFANETDARNEIRHKALQMGANGVDFGKCIRASTPACISSVTCYAEALIVDEGK